MGNIFFRENGISAQIKNKHNLKQCLKEVFYLEKVEFHRVIYIFCTDAFLLSLNKQFLNHNTYTDVITFNLSNAKNFIDSEIYISIERVRENSLFFDTIYKEELFRVMIHGLLHLCGYLDITLKQKKEMRKKEDFYLSNKMFHVKP